MVSLKSLKLKTIDSNRTIFFIVAQNRVNKVISLSISNPQLANNSINS